MEEPKEKEKRQEHEDASQEMDMLVSDAAKKLSENFCLNLLTLSLILDWHLSYLFNRNPQLFRILFARLTDQIWDSLKAVDATKHYLVLDYYEHTQTDKLTFHPFTIHCVHNLQSSLPLFRPEELTDSFKILLDCSTQSITIGLRSIKLTSYLFNAALVLARHQGRTLTEDKFNEEYYLLIKNLKQTHKKFDNEEGIDLAKYTSAVNRMFGNVELPKKLRPFINKHNQGYQLNPIYKAEILS